MSTCSHTYYPSSDSHDWLNAMSEGDKSRIDPRTFQVHQIPTLGSLPPCPPRRSSRRRPLKISRLDHIPRIYSPRPQRQFVVKWLHSTTAIWENVGFEDVPENDTEDINDDDVCSIDEGELVPFSLEAIPPFPKQGADHTLFNLHQRIHHEGAFTELLDSSTCPAYVEDEYRPPRQSILDPSAYTFSSKNVLSHTEDKTRTKNVGKLIASKFRKAARKSVAACRSLREKMRR